MYIYIYIYPQRHQTPARQAHRINSVCLHACEYACSLPCLSMFMCVCMYIFICIYIHTHTRALACIGSAVTMHTKRIVLNFVMDTCMYIHTYQCMYVYLLAYTPDLREANKGTQQLREARDGIVRKDEEKDADEEEEHAADEPPRPSFLGV